MTIENLITILTSQSQPKKISQIQIGQIIDVLIKYQHFDYLANTYGREYLVKMLEMHVVEPYILRKSRYLIDSTNTYVLIEGKIQQNGFNNGEQISVERDGKIKAFTDCLFLKISIKQLNSKKIKNLHLYEAQKIKQINSLSTKILYNQQKQQISQKIKSIELFNQLSHADFITIVYYSQMNCLFKGKCTHQQGDIIQNLIYILEGEVKLSIPYSLEQQQKKPFDQVLDKLMVKKRKNTKNQISTLYNKGQWIGLEQHFQNVQRFKSFGLVMSVEAKFIYIPVKIFEKLFNVKSNYSSYNKLKYLIKIKADLIEKSCKAQQQKSNQMIRWSKDHAEVSKQLRNKVSKYQLDSNYQDIENNNPQNMHSKIISTSKQKSMQRNNSLVPIKVVHMVKTKQASQRKQDLLQQADEILINSNKIPIKQTTRINLFPQEYEKQFIRPNQQKQIQLAEQHAKTNMMHYLSPKFHRRQCLNVKKLYGQYDDKLNEKFDKHKFQKSYVSLNKKITQNYVLSSSFYREYINKGDELCNLNSKTISCLEESRKNLLISRKKRTEQNANKIKLNFSGTDTTLPIINFGKSSKNSLQKQVYNPNPNFKPMSPSRSGKSSLYAHFLQQKYNIESNKSLIENLLQNKSHNNSNNNSRNIIIDNMNKNIESKYRTINNENRMSSSTIQTQEYSKTLFVNKQRDDEIKYLTKIILNQEKKNSFKRKPSILSIQ